jgi:hypothetical protein
MGEAGVIEGRTNGDQQPRVKTFTYGVLMADFIAQTARAGWMGASAWDMDDGMHVVNGLPHPAIPNELTLKIWGFWNTQGSAMGHPEDEAPRPWFYTWSLMSRFFPKGARIVAGEATDVRVIASQWPEGKKEQTAIMLVNDTDKPRSITVRLPRARRQSLTRYHYFEGDRPVDREGYPRASGTIKKADLARGVTVDLPSRGVVFLTTGS